MSDMVGELKNYTLQNAAGMRAEVLNYGATLAELWVPDKTGELYDVLLGYQHPDSYLRADNPYFNCAVGRYANRINKGAFQYNGVSYRLATGGQVHSLHSGPSGFDKKYWHLINQTDQAIVLGLVSEDGEGGFPGKLEVSVAYELTDNNALRITFVSRCLNSSPVNLTFHGYFQLGGKGTAGHHLTIDGDSYLEVDQDLIPTGRPLSVENTAYDLRRGVRLGNLYDTGIDLDHCYVVNPEGKMKRVASLYGEKMGMTLYTNLPGLQVYTGNGLHPGILGVKKISGYQAYDGLCLEAQYYPDAPNHAHFPSPWILAGEERQDLIEYRFEPLPA